MLIQLRQSEIEDAVKMYVTAQGINLSGKKIDMNFTAGRGSAGITVDIDIADAKLSELVQAPAPITGSNCSPIPVQHEEAAQAKSELPWEGDTQDKAEEVSPEPEAEPAPASASTRLFG